MSRAAVNNLTWVLSVLLQLALLTVVVGRGIARRLPFFTLLLGFYPLRAILLFSLFGHLAAETYAGLYSGLAVAGLVLMLLAAAELAWRLWGVAGLEPAAAEARGWWVGTIVAWSAAATAVLRRQLPVHTPVPVDQVQIFGEWVFTGLAAWALTLPARRLGTLRRVAIGFGVWGLLDVLATVLRTFAASRRDAPAFALWSYVSSGAYLGVVIFWIVTLKRDRADVEAEPRPLD